MCRMLTDYSALALYDGPHSDLDHIILAFRFCAGPEKGFVISPALLHIAPSQTTLHIISGITRPGFNDRALLDILAHSTCLASHSVSLMNGFLFREAAQVTERDPGQSRPCRDKRASHFGSCWLIKRFGILRQRQERWTVQSHCDTTRCTCKTNPFTLTTMSAAPDFTSVYFPWEWTGMWVKCVCVFAQRKIPIFRKMQKQRSLFFILHFLLCLWDDRCLWTFLTISLGIINGSWWLREMIAMNVWSLVWLGWI